MLLGCPQSSWVCREWFQKDWKDAGQVKNVCCMRTRVAAAALPAEAPEAIACDAAEQW